MLCTMQSLTQTTRACDEGSMGLAGEYIRLSDYFSYR